MQLRADVEVRVDTARGAFLKRRDDGRVDFVSPVPCPFNYGSVLGVMAADGQRQDAIVLGPALARGTRLRARVLGRVRFIDAGVADDKWLCGEGLTPSELLRVERFFWLYARIKHAAYWLRGARARTRFDGVELREPLAG